MRATSWQVCFYLFAAMTLLCQQKSLAQFYLRGTVVDKSTEEAIPFANILNLDNGSGTTTNLDGQFELAITSVPVRIRISSIGYETDTIIVNDFEEQRIKLRPSVSDLPMVEVNANRKYEVIGEEAFTPLKFTVWSDYIFLLEKKGTFGPYQVQVFNQEGRLLKKHQLDFGRVANIETNCLNNLYIRNNSFSIQFEYTGAQLEPLEKIPNDDFDRTFTSCKCSSEKNLFFEVKSFNGLLKKYVQVETNTGVSKLLKTIEFRDRINNYRQDFGLITSGERSSNMGDISVSENERIRNLQEDGEFLENIFYKNSTNNYLFVVDSQLVVFNFDEHQIEFFDHQGNTTHLVEMKYFDDSKQWQDLVLFDRETQKFYTIQDIYQDFVLCQLDPYNGKIVERYPLDIKNFEKIEVINDHAFLLGIPKETYDSSKKQFLFRRIF